MNQHSSDIVWAFVPLILQAIWLYFDQFVQATRKERDHDYVSLRFVREYNGDGKIFRSKGQWCWGRFNVMIIKNIKGWLGLPAFAEIIQARCVIDRVS